jgi:hypothetical protein
VPQWFLELGRLSASHVRTTINNRFILSVYPILICPSALESRAVP